MSLLRSVIVLLIGQREFSSTNQKHYPNLGSNKSSVWNFRARSSELRPVVASQNVSCYLRLCQKKLTPPVYSSVSSFSGHHVLLKKPTYPHPPGTCSLNFKHKPIYTGAWCTSMLLYLWIKLIYFEIAVHIKDPLPDNKLLSVKLSTDTNFVLLRIPEHWNWILWHLTHAKLTKTRHEN